MSSTVEVKVVNFETKPHKPDCACMVCPTCGATEIADCSKPIDEWKWQIRPFRMDEMSHCLMCNNWF